MQATAEDVLAFLKDKGLVLSTAESCTSGLIASALADVSGAGACLDRAFVTYSVEAKIEMLGVRRDTIERCNLTSEAVAREMALGALAASRADVTVANTGVVDSTDDEIPAGTQCLAWAFRQAGDRPVIFSETVRFDGDRRALREQCVRYALTQLPVYYRRMAGGTN